MLSRVIHHDTCPVWCGSTLPPVGAPPVATAGVTLAWCIFFTSPDTSTLPAWFCTLGLDSICDVVVGDSPVQLCTQTSERVFVSLPPPGPGCPRRYTYVLTAFGWGAIFHPVPQLCVCCSAADASKESKLYIYSHRLIEGV